MKIGIDAHYIGQQSGGNETYMRNLLEGLRELHPPAEFILFAHRQHMTHPALQGFQVEPLPVESSYLRVPIALPWLAQKHRLDLLHVNYTAPPWCPCPYVVTLHDAVMLRHPDSLPFATRHRLRLATPATLRRAARVFTVSEAMRVELSASYALPRDTITVTPNALSDALRTMPTAQQCAAVRNKYGLPEHYVLSLGQIQPRKNLARLAQAYSRLDARQFPHTLVVAGKRAWLYGDLLKDMEHLERQGRILFTGYVDDADLPCLYAMASVFAFVSLYEGFGIPVIEALAMGVPVLASTDPALMEVAGGGALHVDANDADAIANGLRALLVDEQLRQRLVQTGQPHALAYTPRRSAEAAWAGYQAALQQRRPS